MKTFLLASVAALGLGTTANAAIIRFDYQSPEMALHPDSVLEVWHENDAFDRFNMFITIDTDKVQDGRVNYTLDSDMRPVYGAGVVDAFREIPYTEMKVSFSNDWQVPLYDIWYDSDGYMRPATNDGSHSALYSGMNTAFWYGDVGTWTRTVLDGELEAPAPVPLPAAGFLLIAGLGALGLNGVRNRKWNKA